MYANISCFDKNVLIYCTTLFNAHTLKEYVRSETARDFPVNLYRNQIKDMAKPEACLFARNMWKYLHCPKAEFLKPPCIVVLPFRILSLCVCVCVSMKNAMGKQAVEDIAVL